MNEEIDFPKANYEFWLKRNKWHLKKAICLLFRKEPFLGGYKHFYKDGCPTGEGEFVIYRRIDEIFNSEMNEAYTLLRTDRKSPKLKIENYNIKPIRFIKWAKQNDYPLPQEFEDFLKQNQTKKKSVRLDPRQELIERTLLILRKKVTRKRRDITAMEIFKELNKSYKKLADGDNPLIIIDSINLKKNEIVFCKPQGGTYEPMTFSTFENRVTRAKKKYHIK